MYEHPVALHGQFRQLTRLGTQQAQGFPVRIGRENVLLIDTPGFDDTVRDDTEILTEISRLLTFQYESGMKLKGVIYLHRITDVRMTGTAVRTLQICRRICGTSALSNVILTTTRWKDVESQAIGAQREQELRNDFWKFMLDYDSTMMRYHGDHDSAVAIISQLLQKDTVVLDIQRELVDQGKKLSDTTAGTFVHDNFEEVKKRYEKELKDLAQLRADLALDRSNMKLQLQEEIENERAKYERLRLEATRKQEMLDRRIADEVRSDIEREERKGNKLSGLGYLPMMISIMGSFFGIPSGATNMFFAWFEDTSIGEAVADFLGSF